jgi:hypothetical protein
MEHRSITDMKMPMMTGRELKDQRKESSSSCPHSTLEFRTVGVAYMGQVG